MKRYPKRCSVQDRNPNKQCLFTPSNILRKLILSNRKLKFLTEQRNLDKINMCPVRLS